MLCQLKSTKVYIKFHQSQKRLSDSLSDRNEVKMNRGNKSASRNDKLDLEV